MNQDNRKNTYAMILVHCYVVISLFNCNAFLGGADYAYTLLGSQSITLPFWGLLMAVELESMGIVWASVAFWIVGAAAILYGYIMTLWKKRCRIFGVVIIMDAVATVIFVISNVIYGGILDLHFFLLVGAVVDAVIGVYLIRCPMAPAPGSMAAP